MHLTGLWFKSVRKSLVIILITVSKSFKITIKNFSLLLKGMNTVLAEVS